MGKVWNGVKNVVGGGVGGLVGGGGMGGIGGPFQSPTEAAGGMIGGLSGGNTPQDRGYGVDNSVTDPSQFQQYQTMGMQGDYDPMNPGAAGDPMAFMRGGAGQGWAGSGQMTQGPNGWDMTSPGQVEQYWNNQQGRMNGPSVQEGFLGRNQDRVEGPTASQDYAQGQVGRTMGPGKTSEMYDQTKGAFGAPGSGEQYWNQVSGKFNKNTNSQAFYDQAKQQDAGLGAYYDRAKQRSTKDINNQLAARGTYGSSVGEGQLADAITGLDADRANRESQYHLQEQGQLGGLAGQADQYGQSLLGLGSSASNNAQQQALARAMGGIQAGQTVDQTDLARYLGGVSALGQGDQMDLSKFGMGMNASQGVDQAELGRFMAGLQGAGTSQDAFRQRGQDYINNTMGFGNQTSGLIGQAMQQLLGGDQSLMDASMGMNLGLGAEALNQDQRTQEKMMSDATWAKEITGGNEAANVFGSGGGGQAAGGAAAAGGGMEGLGGLMGMI